MSVKVVDPKHISDKDIEKINEMIKGANTVVIAVEKNGKYSIGRFNMTIQEAVFLSQLIAHRNVEEAIC